MARDCHCPRWLDLFSLRMTKPTLPILYSFRRCPYAMRARLALLVSGQTCELREVVLAQKPAALLEASPKGTVPVLELPDGQVVDQSLEIMLWGLQRHDPQCWLTANGLHLDDMLTLVSRCDTEFKFNLDRYKYPHRFGLPNGESHRTAGALFLNDLNTRLSRHAQLMGDSPSLADAAIAPFVRQFAHTDDAWFAAQPWSALQAWLTAFENSSAFQQVMLKFERWAPDDPRVQFPASFYAII
jgi:glutathione S-transferase